MTCFGKKLKKFLFTFEKDCVKISKVNHALSYGDNRSSGNLSSRNSVSGEYFKERMFLQ